jgi:uncharacterized membrane protein YccF (DUF307 family)
MQFNPLESGQQGQFGPDQQYSQGQPHQQPPEGTWQQQPPQGYPGQQMYAPQMQQPMYPPPVQQPMYPPQMQQPMYPPPVQQPIYPPQMQQPMYPYPPAQPVMMPQQVVNVNIQQNQPGLFIRALYFLFIGWWAGLIWLNIGYFFVVTIIGLPVGLIMLNRLPLIMTLKPASQSVNINITGNTTNINITTGAQQVNFLIRALYFVFVGWWAGLLWSYVAYTLFVLIVTIPVGVIMFNMLPAIITLRKN